MLPTSTERASLTNSTSSSEDPPKTEKQGTMNNNTEKIWLVKGFDYTLPFGAGSLGSRLVERNEWKDETTTRRSAGVF